MADTEYNALRCEEHTRDLDAVVGRVQKLVDDYHAGNVNTATFQGRLDMLTQRVPVDLQKQLTELAVKLDGLNDNFRLLRGQVYAFAFIIISGFVTAIGGLVYRGMR